MQVELDYDQEQQVEMCGGVGEAGSEWMTADGFVVDNNNGDVMSVQHHRQPQHRQQQDNSQHVATSVAAFGSQMINPNSRTPYSDATQCKKIPANHIKRPMNAFMVWSQVDIFIFISPKTVACIKEKKLN